MKHFQAVLTAAWTKSPDFPNEIVGVWAEDGNEYKFKVPLQLTNQIIAMQNYVYDLHVEVIKKEQQIKEMEQELSLIKRARGYY